INPNTLQGSKGGQVFDVSPREIQLLQYFFAHEGEALDRYKILDKIWGVKYGGTTRTLDQHVAKLRQKIEDDPQNPRYVITVHRVGYRFVKESR
ncbi:MAG: helix-turn-helix domain-containing protein, partial [Candidatus Omnitrophica bacterium]|nr:helix-turn-helix domain-containing protein [Candidatus Omnitrophota bacterium]